MNSTGPSRRGQALQQLLRKAYIDQGAKRPTTPCNHRDTRQHRIDDGAISHDRMLSNTAIEPASTPKQGRPCCLTIRRNAIKLKRDSRRHRKRLKMPTRPGRTMSPRLGLFEKRLQD